MWSTESTLFLKFLPSMLIPMKPRFKSRLLDFYVLPRLSGFWSHLGRQRGGVGVKGGEGEQQIELDRRIIRERIEFLKKELKTVERSRVEQRKKRQNKAVTAALVGYTNAGKSSLMNRLCRVDILEEDKLFATLDSTYRMLNPTLILR